MTNSIRKTMAVLFLGATAMMMSVGAQAQEWPTKPGDYWEVTGIKIADGGGLKYMSWLASEWRENLEFAKSQGWIKDYMMLSNVHARSDEPDLYLVRVMDSLVSADEGAKRRKAYMEWRKKTVAEMQAESGNRAEYRTVMSESLLRELKFRN